MFVKLLNICQIFKDYKKKIKSILKIKTHVIDVKRKVKRKNYEKC